MILQLGQYKNAEGYLKAIKKVRNVSLFAEDVIKKVSIGKKRKVEVTLLTFKDLGLTEEWQTTQSIKGAAVAKGYTLPDAEIALALALKKEDLGYWRVPHDPITDSDGLPYVLCSHRHDDGRWVGTCWDRPGHDWDGVGAFAFVVPASASNSETETSFESLSLEARIEAIESILANHNLT